MSLTCAFQASRSCREARAPVLPLNVPSASVRNDLRLTGVAPRRLFVVTRSISAPPTGCPIVLTSLPVMRTFLP